MAKSDNFRKQHEDMKQAVGQIAGLLNPAQLKADGEKLRQLSSLLAKLTGKLTLHLAMEDKVLYPSLLGSSDGGAKGVAQKYMTEMGGIAKAYEQYSQKWKTPQVIQANPEQFCGDTKNLFDALGKRIAKEESELYPMYDKAA